MFCVGWTGPLPSLLDGWHNAPLWSSIHGYAAPYHRITCTFVQTTCSSSTPAHCHELSTRHFAYKIHIHWGQSPARPHTPCTHSAKHMSWLAADQVHTQPACITQLGPGRHSGKWQQWQATHPLRLDASLMQTADGRARAPQCWLHWMDLMSMPSWTISQRGLISRSFSTCATVSTTARSTSASVVNLPSPNLARHKHHQKAALSKFRRQAGG